MTDDRFTQLIAEALRTPFEGWDFGVFQGRYDETGSLPWSYEALVRDHLGQAASLLDLGTGGGELLASLAPLPARTAATEGYAPNVPVARRRLGPLGVKVVEVDDDRLPFPDKSFDLVINRHESYDPGEVRRVLKKGGTFLTQQVGGRDLHEVNEALGGPPNEWHAWDLRQATEGLLQAGFEVTWREEARVPAVFRDVGALVLYLRLIPWQVPGFTVERYGERLRQLHDGGFPLHVTCHRFAVRAVAA
ncbi:class I SAM-dependent methyltransferase [Thermoactinospora rubra]|uniref:class I SAM-dependent methyltransferase n=1 Tax=Thermoactinospora rubra TaxID=1088767 RepID=UPI000A122540|nr:class I SAM-dependent methyltransferase [Thermoactinospora rubra]